MDTSKANDDGGGSVASSKRKRQTTSKNTSDISSSARVTRGAMRIEFKQKMRVPWTNSNPCIIQK